MDWQRAPYAGWTNCCRISDGRVELVVTLDVGPRIIRFGLIGGDNEFKEFPKQVGLRGGDEWRSYGGHRLWLAPEDPVRSYYPDNGPVEMEDHGEFLRFLAPPETTGIQKEIDITLKDGLVSVNHRLRNVGGAPLDVAGWAISVMAPGGTAIVPLPPRGPHPENLLPTASVALWPYTDMSDPRWTWGTRLVLLTQDRKATSPQKAGIAGAPGWAAYANRDRLFLKTFAISSRAPYPDMGSSVEVFTDSEMLELETLGPLARVEPGKSVEHEEEWYLFDGVVLPSDEDGIERVLRPLLAQVAVRFGADRKVDSV